MKTSVKKYIIFDMDGTLSNTAMATTGALNEIGKQFSLPEVSQSEVRSVMGYADPEFFYRMYPHHPRDLLKEIRPLVNSLEDNMIEALGKKILFPGIEDLLKSLFEKGYILYVASTGSTSHVHVTLQAAGISCLFKAIHCNEPCKVEMVKSIINGYNNDEFIMIGDMIKDSQAARSNSVTVLGAAYGYLDINDHHLFDAILYTPDEIFNYL